MNRIVHLEGPSAQGQTRPIFCVAENGVRYVAKGLNAGRLALIREWIAGKLGLAFGIPIPSFVQLELAPELLEFDATGYAKALGSIPLFCSQREESVVEFDLSNLPGVDEELRARIALFDWWVANGDRTLFSTGGNPNLLWRLTDQSLVVIDHNLAFDLDLCHDFKESHVFRADIALWDDSFRAREAGRMSHCLANLENIWNELPEAWTEPGFGIDLESARNLLGRFATDPAPFWSIQ